MGFQDIGRTRRPVQCSVLNAAGALVGQLALTIAVAVSCSGFAQAQETKPAAPAAQAAITPQAGDIIYLPGEDGKPVPVQASASLKEYLAFLANRGAANTVAPPQASVSSITLSGNADEQRVLLEAKLRVQIQPADQWVRVPLRLEEAYLTKEPAYTGPGEHAPAEFQTDGGYAWWFKGAGQHELTVSLSVPLQKLPLTRRLQLSLPATAVSSMTLGVPHSGVSARTTERSTLTVKNEADRAEIQVLGLGHRIDLTWELSEPGQAVAHLEARTLIFANVDEAKSLSLEVTQVVQALRGSFDQLRVTLPAGFTLKQLRVDEVDHQDYQLDPASPTVVLVRLPKSTSGPVQLRWNVTKRLSGSESQIPIEGFQIDRVDIHTGNIAVAVLGEYVLVRSAETEQGVERQSSAGLPAVWSKQQIAEAYRILEQPFRLGLSVRKLEPYISVDRQAAIHFTTDSVELETTFRLQVHRANISELKLNWPEARAAGWIIEPLDEPAALEEVTDTAEPTAYRIRLLEPTKGSFRLRIRARRPWSLEQQPVPITLPALEATRQSPLEFCVTSAENLNVDFQPVGMTQLRPLPASSASRLLPNNDAQHARPQCFRAEGPNPQFTSRLTAKSREVTTQSTVRIAAAAGRWNVTQAVGYDVLYERLNQVRLRVPSGLRPGQARFYLRGNELAPSWGTPTPQGTPVQLPLDQPRLGRFEVEIRYRAEAPPAGRDRQPVESLHIPIFRPLEATLAPVRLEWLDGSVEPKIEGEQWLRQSVTEGNLWTSSEWPDNVTIQLLRSGEPALRGRVISKLWSRSFVDPTGAIQTLVHARLASPAGIVRVRPPAPYQRVQIWWNSEPATWTEGRSEAGDGRPILLVNPPQTALIEPLLTISLRTDREPLNPWYAHLDLPAVRFDGLWIADSKSEVWLPGDQHLFSAPQGMTPEYEWRFSNLHWRRFSQRSVADIAGWIGLKNGPGELSPQVNGNRYVFGRLGANPSLSLSVMSQKGLILFGAGVGALLALILISVRALRHILTFLLLGFSLAVAGVVYPTEVAVLLQPAGVGLLIAAVCGAAQNWIARRRQQTLATLTAGDMSSVHSAILPSDAPRLGSNDYTQLHQQATTGLQVNMPAEVGQP